MPFGENFQAADKEVKPNRSQRPPSGQEAEFREAEAARVHRTEPWRKGQAGKLLRNSINYHGQGKNKQGAVE